MINYLRILLTTFFLLSFCGCIRDVEDKKLLTEFKSKLVVASFISPDDNFIAVYLKKTRPFFNDTLISSLERVDDALVTLSDGFTSVNLTYNPTNSFSTYIVNASLLPIISGKTYFLTIRVPSGITVKSKCTIPFPVQIERITVLDSQIRSGTDTLYTVQAEWKNSSADIQYYGFETVTQELFYRKDPPGDTMISISQRLNIYSDGGTFRKSETNGKGIGIFNAIKYLNDNLSGFYYNKPIGFNLLITEKTMYEYSLYSRRQAGDFYPLFQIDDDSLPTIDGFPYSEPTMNYTNIEGGYGIFGGYVRVRKNLNL